MGEIKPFKPASMKSIKFNLPNNIPINPLPKLDKMLYHIILESFGFVFYSTNSIFALYFMWRRRPEVALFLPRMFVNCHNRNDLLKCVFYRFTSALYINQTRRRVGYGIQIAPITAYFRKTSESHQIKQTSVYKNYSSRGLNIVQSLTRISISGFDFLENKSGLIVPPFVSGTARNLVISTLVSEFEVHCKP